MNIVATGGGSGTGIAELIKGGAQICFSVREMRNDEREQFRAKFGEDPTPILICFQALAIYIHPTNPLHEIPIGDLREIWAEGGKVDTWDQLKGGGSGPIVRFGSPAGTGSFGYFRDMICGNDAKGRSREFKPGMSEFVGMSEVVEHVSKTPNSVCYAAPGYKTPGVKWLAISGESGGKAELPNEDAVRQGLYPLNRRCYVYVVGKPKGSIRAFLDWIVGVEGQKFAKQLGFISLH